MLVKWKRFKALKPEVILRRIERSRTVSPEGKVSFTGYDLHDALPALRSMIEIPAPHGDYEPARLVWRAISRITTELTPESFIKAINDARREESATKEVIYVLLTSISIDPRELPSQLRVLRINVRLLRGDYPRRYSSIRSKELSRSSLPVPNVANGYANVILSVRAKNPRQAARRALRDFDLLRGVWCLMANHTMEIVGQEWKPINRIRLGPVHTVHFPNGNLAAEEVWFEPSFSQADIFQSTDPTLKKNAAYILRKLRTSPYSGALCDALVRYVQALDEGNQRNALVRLWSALERLALRPEQRADYELMIDRTASIFVEDQREYHEQILRHLRQSRNDSVHAGTDDDSKTLCFQVQFYFFRLLIVLLNMKGVRSLQEAHELLDLPRKVESLDDRLRIVRAAKRFRSLPSLSK